MKNVGLLVFAYGCGTVLGCGSAQPEEAGQTPGGQEQQTSPGDQPSTTPSDEPPPPDWACLSDQARPSPREPERVRYAVSVFDFDSQPSAPRAVPDLRVRVCSGSCAEELPACLGASTPLEQCYGLSAGSAPFELVFDIPFAFANATLNFTAPGYAELDYALGGPMIGAPDGEMTVVGVPLPMFSELARMTIHSDLGVSAVDPARGVLLGRVLNCEGARSAGMRVEATTPEALPGAVAFRFESSTLAVPAPLETAPLGIAGFVNVPTGAISIETETPGGKISTAVRVRANVITIAELRPGLGVWGQ